MTKRLLDRYTLMEELGHGGMAVVHRARDERLGRDVAVKQLHPHLAADPEHRRRLHREAQAVARLSHPHIVDIHDYSGEGDREACIVTELIRGRTLKAFVHEHPAGVPEIAAAIGWVVADALTHAHAHGIVHRDLKVENVMVGVEGAPSLKLVDFGLARLTGAGDRLTVTGSLIGSPAHMAPELIDGAEAHAGSDLFALGTLLYTLSCGIPPFAAPSPGALLRKIVALEFDPPRRLAPALSDRFDSLIARLLSRRESRPSSAADVRDELGRVLAEAGVGEPTTLALAFFAEPDRVRSETRLTVARRLLDDALKDLRERRAAKALARYARVLALMPGTSEAGEARRGIDTVRRRKTRRRWVVVLAATSLTTGLCLFALRHRTQAPAHIVSVPTAPALPAPDPTAKPAASPDTTVPALPTPPSTPSGFSIPRENPREPRRASAPTVKVQPSRGPSTPVAAPFSPVAQGLLRVHVQPFARIILDGRTVAENRTWEGKVDAGPHHLSLSHDCCSAAERDIVVDGDKSTELRERLVPKPARLVVSVAGARGASLMVDGTFTGEVVTGDVKPFAVEMGRDDEGRWRYDRAATVRLFSTGFGDWTRSVRLRAGQETRIDATMAPGE